MSYQVLARKYRPKNFTQVVGQEYILRALINALTQNRLHHAYLLTGTRGVGKTTIARILAKCLNCETGVTATPCGQCEACQEIDAGRFIDLVEVDAASRTKVEDTRDLLDNVQYLPAKGRFKIYIIDEVHMLSGHSFNALLKTLEEPPEHVKFLLATTDPQKLPITVLSRCLQFNLRAVTPATIAQQLAQILMQEQIKFEAPALHSIAIAANGSVRDALSLLDQAIAFGHGKIATTDIDAMLGNVDTGKIFALMQALVSNDAKQILIIIADLASLAVDFIGVLDNLLAILQQLAILQLVPEADTSNWQRVELISSLASQLQPEEVQLYYQIGLIGKRDLPLAPTMRLGFEMLMLRMLAFRPASLDQASSVTTQEQKPLLRHNDDLAQVSPVKLHSDRAAAAYDDISSNNEATGIEILQKLVVTGPTQALLQHCVITSIGQDQVNLSLDAKYALWLNKRQEEAVGQALSQYLQRQVKAVITPAAVLVETMAVKHKRETTEKQQQAKQAIAQDPNITALINQFDAKIIAAPAALED